ncbi:MAG: hypothetical protein GF388_03650 [Candidatus Aegiribacteria sp.]|nr:hypothetical protein [Candidatus Aegiribacteria sp.]MBD3294358.1 hypothetical protein [Candidatus Fermentibacteria bacterium]
MKRATLFTAIIVFGCFHSLTAEVPSDAADSILIRLAENGPEGVVDYIQGFQPRERLQLYGLAREVLVFRQWEGKNLDDIVEVSDSGILEAMTQANTASDPDTIRALLDVANVMSYNLSADLAECWPGDTLIRTRDHFQRGLSAALQCVEWRRELEKGDYPLFMAYWAAGMHQMSLDRPEEAVYNLVKSLNHAQQITIDEGRSLGLHPGAGFELILAHGYLGLAMEMCGMEDDQYERAIEAFSEGALEYPELAGDYDFGIQQLRWARDNLLDR